MQEQERVADELDAEETEVIEEQGEEVPQPQEPPHGLTHSDTEGE